MRGRETSLCVASRMPPTGNLAHNPGMCPGWESNPGPFKLQASTQSTEPHQPGRIYVSVKERCWNLLVPKNLTHFCTSNKKTPPLKIDKLLFIMLESTSNDHVNAWAILEVYENFTNRGLS